MIGSMCDDHRLDEWSPLMIVAPTMSVGHDGLDSPIVHGLELGGAAGGAHTGLVVIQLVATTNQCSTHGVQVLGISSRELDRVANALHNVLQSHGLGTSDVDQHGCLLLHLPILEHVDAQRAALLIHPGIQVPGGSRSSLVMGHTSSRVFRAHGTIRVHGSSRDPFVFSKWLLTLRRLHPSLSSRPTTVVNNTLYTYSLEHTLYNITFATFASLLCVKTFTISDYDVFESHY